jgi:glutamate 5-kinase
MTDRARILDPARIRRVVVKLGSAILTHPRRGLREEVIGGLAEQVATLGDAQALQFVVVSSGSIAAGRKLLGLTGRLSLVEKQASAAVGQTQLMEAYERAFARRGRRVGQLLLTHDDFQARDRYVNARQTLEALLSLGVVPVINENDTVSTDEIRLGDNDQLAALVAHMIEADLVILLTEHDGVYSTDPDRDPGATRVSTLARIDDALIESMRPTREDRPGSGGMASKLLAARQLASWGCPVVITRGCAEQPIEEVLSGRDVGTLVLPMDVDRASSRKMWIAHARRPQGALVVDAGARRAIEADGRSLLAAGVVGLRGVFPEGGVVTIEDCDGVAFARGITGWTSADIEAGMGRRSVEARGLLREGLGAAVIHRDNLALLPAEPGAPA